MKRYFSLLVENEVADLDIYGDITSWPWYEGDISAAILSKQLEELGPVKQINVHINSYGGEVAEGLAIYNALRRNDARIVTTCDGMACSIASVIFMAGDERIMSESSLLMIHNAWSYACGNAFELRKQADDLETITEASKKAYLSRVNISEEKLSEMMDKETFITAEEAFEMGFSTLTETYEPDHASQSARQLVVNRLTRPTLEESFANLSNALNEVREYMEKLSDDEEDDTDTETDETTDDETDDEEEEVSDEDTDEGDDEDKKANQSYLLAFTKFLERK